MEENRDIKFIASHYRKGLFKVEPALRRIRHQSTRWWTRSRIAAASVVAIIMTATAAIFVHDNYFSTSTPETELSESPSASEIVRVIDFEEAPLTEVVQKIKDVYGVEVTNLPTDPDKYLLSLHYEGSALDLVDTINDILDIEMTVEQ